MSAMKRSAPEIDETNEQPEAKKLNQERTTDAEIKTECEAWLESDLVSRSTIETEFESGIEKTIKTEPQIKIETANETEFEVNVESGQPFQGHQDLNADADDKGEKSDGNSAAKAPSIISREQLLNRMFKNADRGSANVTRAEINKACQALGGQAYVKARDDGNWILKGMQAGLHLHQLLAVGWMRDRENSTEGPRGGILADDMGLGKTIQTIATIVNDMETAGKKAARNQTTLIVCMNLPLAKQWRQELSVRCDPNNTRLLNRVLGVYTGSKFEGSIQTLESQRVIVTTYQELMSQAKHLDSKSAKFTSDKQEKRWFKMHSDSIGPFFKMNFHRVVLDEGQKANNRRSFTSEVCRELTSKHHWILTGTPLQNRVAELYPYLDFIKYPGLGSFKNFNEKLLKPYKQGEQSTLEDVLKNSLMRRKGDDTYFGKKILSIPKGEEKMLYFDLDPNEKKRYDKAESEAIRRLTKVIKEEDGKISTVVKKLALWEFMQLLQDSTHPLLRAHAILSDQAQPNTAMEQGEKYNAQDQLDEPAFTVDDLKQLILEGGRANEIQISEIDRIVEFIQDLSKEYSKQLNEFEEEKTRIRNEAEALHKDERFREASIKDEVRAARKVFIRPVLFKYSTLRWRKKKLPVILSTKVKLSIDLIQSWLEEDPEQKIIVFSQFIEMLEILALALKDSSICCHTYHGEMSGKLQLDALDAFKTNNEIKVLVASFKAGGTGLNLTCASRVIICEPYWNRAREDQAIGRCRRIGQIHKTEVVRLIAKGTIDERLVEMQQNKSAAIDEVLSGNSNLATKLLSIEDVLNVVYGTDAKNLQPQAGKNKKAPVENHDSDDDSSDQSDSDDDDSGDDDDEYSEKLKNKALTDKKGTHSSSSQSSGFDADTMTYETTKITVTSQMRKNKN